MNKIFTLIFICMLICPPALLAQSGVTITGSRADTDGDLINITFRAMSGMKAVKGGSTVVFVPTITDGTNKWSLPPVIVQGRRGKIASQRQNLTSGSIISEPALYEGALWLKGGESADYSITTDWQPWMGGADVIAEILRMGCCSFTVDALIVYNNIPLPAVDIADIETEDVPQTILPPKTTGEILAETRSFILPYSQFEKLAPGQLFDDDRENSIMVYFHQNRFDLIPEHSDNSSSLDKLLSSIREIENSSDSRVRSIVIAGFASPEGPFTFNDRLAFDRAAETKRYIMEHCELPDEMISLYNGSEDWRGLRILVEQSQMPSKAQVLDIIDNVPIWDNSLQRGRLGELMRLEGGSPYSYMFENFFPKLRNAAYIKIYYENK